jgi:hypothetical protein
MEGLFIFGINCISALDLFERIPIYYVHMRCLILASAERKVKLSRATAHFTAKTVRKTHREHRCST